MGRRNGPPSTAVRRPTRGGCEPARPGDRTRAMVGLAAAMVAWATPLHGQGAAPTSLRDALVRALETHPSIEAAHAAVESAEALLASARSGYLPSVSVDGSVTRFQEPMLVAPLHGFDPAATPDFDPTLVRGLLGARYTLFDGGARRAGSDRADAMVAASREDRRDTEARLIETTAEAYLSVLAARDVVAAQERREVALEDEVARAARLLDEGAAAPLVLLRAEAELASAQADGEGARQGLELALTSLARLIDTSPAELRSVSLDDPGLPTDDPPAFLAPDSSVVDVLGDAPALARAQSMVDVAEADLRQARAAWLPSVEAALGYNLFAGGSTDPVAEWQAGLQLRYPIFTGGARRGATDRAAAEAQRARARARVVTEQLAQAADRARTAEREARRRVIALEAAVTRYTELARVERLALDEGAGMQSDWLRAEAGLFQARALLTDARFAVLRARLAWGRAIGHLDLDWVDTLTETNP